MLAAREAYRDPATGHRRKPGAKLGDAYQARSLPVAKQRCVRMVHFRRTGRDKPVATTRGAVA